LLILQAGGVPPLLLEKLLSHSNLQILGEVEPADLVDAEYYSTQTKNVDMNDNKEQMDNFS
jgi:hypothetical protein